MHSFIFCRGSLSPTLGVLLREFHKGPLKRSARLSDTSKIENDLLGRP
jgi:hypothetical protein